VLHSPVDAYERRREVSGDHAGSDHPRDGFRAAREESCDNPPARQLDRSENRSSRHDKCKDVAKTGASGFKLIRAAGRLRERSAGHQAALSGDTVIVSLGTYFETIDFLGKNITLTSEQGPDVTIIDAHGGGSVSVSSVEKHAARS
jgi:hypothetical protein